ncbi:thiol reductant ABC exporter subunit CydD [Neobacillus sp. SM06]|uniref:thiol reductant ABC exporter subunit CydD n=1 Tax=Neobacillus sp. SM06 TaxID=3422492 RepID=UPI003D2792AB
MDKSLFSYKGIKPVLVLLAVLTAIQAVMIIIQAYFLADSISSLFGGDLFRHTFEKIAIFFLALISRQAMTFLKKKLAYQFAVKTSVNLRKSVINKLFQLGPRFVREEGTGQTVTLILEGTMKFRRYLELFLPKLMNMTFIPAMVVIFIFFENVRSAVILILAFPILIIFMILLGLAARSKADRQYQSYQMLSNHFVDSLRGLETLKYLGLSRKHSEKISLVSEHYRHATMATLRVAFLSTFALDFFTMLSIATVAVFLGMGLINGTMDLKPALTILILAPEFFLPIREVGADYHATLDGKEAGRKIQEIVNKNSAEQQSESLPQWNATSMLTVNNVSFHYEDKTESGLFDLQFSLAGIKKIGIIGASGAGKSTMIDLLAGFLSPFKGEILIDGKKLSSLSQNDWHRQLTYIPQHPYLFHDTILNNIRFYHPEAAQSEVENAVRAAGLHKLIEELPNGLETTIGEGGRTISGGQEQRIALARAFLGNRPILLLDEPTAHLDIETEADLKETMLLLFEGKLVFLATHRLHWMRDMDQILVLDQGRLVETGNHEQLMNKKGYYFRLVMAQKEGLQ